jgi:HK97 family phage major capsid protein
MPTLKSLEDQGHALFAQQKALVEDESRPWTDKADEFNKIDSDIKAVLEQHAALKAVDGSPFAKLGDDKPADQEPQFKSIGHSFVESAEFKSIEPGARFTAAAEVKATITEAAGGVGGVYPQYVAGVRVPTLFRRLTVADLMPQGTMASASLIYVQETAVTNAAATVAEGGAKPQSDITLAQVTENARKIATTSKISDEMIQDVDYIVSYVNGRLVLFVQLAEEDQLLNGNGTAPNLRGILQRSGLAAAQAVGADTRVDALYKEITKIRAGAFLEPDGIVIHPTDWQTIRLLKDANQQYYGGGPFTGAYGNGATLNEQGQNGGSGESLWGIRVVVTPAIAQGTALVGAFGTGAQVLRRTGITVEMTNSNEDDFKNNLVAIRAEERLGLAVYRPGAFGTVTGL